MENWNHLRALIAVEDKMLNKKGFTLIEVVLFLALSGALVAFLIAGTSRSISQKRYNDTVDNFVDYLQGLYSDVNYVQGIGTSGGNSDQAIYGKLIISNDGKTFEEYTVLGSAICNGSESDALTALNGCSPKIASDAALQSAYRLSWGGIAQSKNDSNDNQKIAFLIITHPSTGMKMTYVKLINSGNIDETSILNSGQFDNFKNDQDINFCISSDDESAAGYVGGKHKLIKIHKGANNASGVEIINDDKRSGLCE